MTTPVCRLPPAPARRRLSAPAYQLYGLPAYVLHRPEYVFILSHMRSGSTLLVHLLADNPEICGFGETHVPYHAGTPDLMCLIGKVMATLRRLPGVLGERYVLDKILHDHLASPDCAALLSPRSRLVFLLREPAGAISSTITSLGHSEPAALEHYLGRLRFMAAVAARRGPRDIALTHAQLIDRTGSVFRLIEQSLGLRTPLCEQYNLLPTTGKEPYGDPSPNISAGMILRDGQKQTVQATLARETVERAQAAYEECWETLQDHCRTLCLGS